MTNWETFMYSKTMFSAEWQYLLTSHFSSMQNCFQHVTIHFQSFQIDIENYINVKMCKKRPLWVQIKERRMPTHLFTDGPDQSKDGQQSIQLLGCDHATVHPVGDRLVTGAGRLTTQAREVLVQWRENVVPRYSTGCAACRFSLKLYFWIRFKANTTNCFLITKCLPIRINQQMT